MGTRAPWDRTVHAEYPGMEIVRYDRQGKWYFEPVNTLYPNLKRQHVTISAAVEQAIWACKNGGQVFLDKPGGQSFDARFRRLTKGICRSCGRDLHGYRGPDCRYCDGTAE